MAAFFIIDMTIKERAMALYTSYSVGVGGVAFNGDPLPTAEEMFADESKAKQVAGWMRVAIAYEKTMPGYEKLNEAMVRAKSNLTSAIEFISTIIKEEDWHEAYVAIEALSKTVIALAIWEDISEEL